MSDNLSKLSKITWGAIFANSLIFGYPLDNPSAWNAPREGTEVLVAPAVRDAWETGDDYHLAFDVRWIPGVDTFDPVATGWEGATGWSAFLKWARQMNPLRFYPDKDVGTYYTCYMVEPLRGEPQSEEDGTRRLHMVLVNTAAAEFTGYTYDPES